MAQRSRYPSISLPDAVARIERIYEQEGPNVMSNEVAVKHMGYGSLNGASLTTLASLKKYGLIEGRGEDLKISRDGIVILSDKGAEDGKERAQALRSALISDPIFRELDERFGGKTSELNVVSYLQKRGFAPSAARNAAKSYMESAAFVEQETGSYPKAASSPAEEPGMQVRASPTERPASTSVAQAHNYNDDFIEAPIVITGVSRWPVIRLPKQFSKRNWDDMMTMLNAMERGFITKESPEVSQKGDVSHEAVRNKGEALE